MVAIARTAAAYGARVLTRCRALRLTGQSADPGADPGAGPGADVRDELTGEEFTIRARVVINATGVWAGTLDPQVSLRPSRGSHLVLEPGTLPGLIAGMHVPLPGESKPVRARAAAARRPDLRGSDRRAGGRGRCRTSPKCPRRTSERSWRC
ncbi:hypothetical protein GCM10020220_048000 [Nonomuraea rubra]